MENTDKIPTAEEMEQSGKYDDYTSMMIAFAKMHVEKALEAAQDNVRLRGTPIHSSTLPDETDDYCFTVDKQTIANAYPLTNIL